MCRLYTPSLCLGLLLTVGLAARVASAQTGALDPSFGDGGVVLIDQSFPDLTNPRVFGIDIDQEGRVTAVGDHGIFIFSQAFVLRVLSDGTPDPTFADGEASLVVISGVRDELLDVVALPSGGAVATGTYNFATDTEGVDYGVVTRLLPDGTLDTAFGTDGLVTVQAVGLTGAFQPVRVLEDGRILAAGGGTEFSGSDCVAARLLPGGSLDPSFGESGSVVVVAPWCAAATFDNSGGIVFATQVTNGRWGGLRLLTDGSLDPTFNPIADHPDFERPSSVAVSPSGRVIVAGESASENITLVRFTEDGDLDASFGQDGVVELELGVASWRNTELVVQPDEKLLVAGASDWIARILADGALDPTFGDGGVVSFVGFGDADVSSLTLDAEGRIVVGGNGFIARLLNDLTVASEPSVQPERLALSPPAPNPASAQTTLMYTLAEPAPVRLAVYDVLGRAVAVLAEGVRPAGQHEAALDASRLAPGLYVVRLTAGGETMTRRVTVVR